MAWRSFKNMNKRFQEHRLKNKYFAKPGRHTCIIVLDHLKPTYNIGKIFRSAEAMGVREMHLVGIDFFNVEPAKGSFKYIPTQFHKTFADCWKALRAEGYEIFVMDPTAERVLGHFELPEKSAFVMGHEEYGLSFRSEDFEGVTGVRVAQWGRIQSLNVSVAASIAMYEYTRQHAKP